MSRVENLKYSIFGSYTPDEEEKFYKSSGIPLYADGIIKNDDMLSDIIKISESVRQGRYDN